MRLTSLDLALALLAALWITLLAFAAHRSHRRRHAPRAPLTRWQDGRTP